MKEKSLMIFYVGEGGDVSADDVTRQMINFSEGKPVLIRNTTKEDVEKYIEHYELDECCSSDFCTDLYITAEIVK